MLIEAAKGLGRVVKRAPVKDTRAERVAAAWAWYLEWSQIARTAIHERALRAVLGFGPSRQRASG